MAKRLTIRTSNHPAVTISRAALGRSRLVYIAKANKRFKYPENRSAIAYIGTTEVGVRRIATSAAVRAQKLLGLHGVKELKFYVITCKKKRRVKSWEKLEDDLLHVFKREYGRLPIGNKKGPSRRDHFRYFNENRLRSVLRRYE